MRKLTILFLLISSVGYSQISTRCAVCPPTLKGVPDGYVLRDSSSHARWQSLPIGDSSKLWSTDGTHLYPTDNSMFVGIGTTAPAGLLQVQGTHGYWLFNDVGKQYTQSINGGDDYVTLYGGGSYADHFYQVTVGDQSYFQQYNNRFLFNSGNVGIRKSPDNALSVSGNADFTGNVGIGISTPNYKLDISGKFNAVKDSNLISLKDTLFATNIFGEQIDGSEQMSIGSSGYAYSFIGRSKNLQHCYTGALVNEYNGRSASYFSGYNPNGGGAVISLAIDSLTGDHSFLTLTHKDEAGKVEAEVLNENGNKGDFEVYSHGVSISAATASNNSEIFVDSNSINFQKNAGTNIFGCYTDLQQIFYKDGNQALGKVLTSDANGLATWSKITVNNQFDFSGLPQYANNSAALSGGLTVGEIYIDNSYHITVVHP